MGRGQDRASRRLGRRGRAAASARHARVIRVERVENARELARRRRGQRSAAAGRPSASSMSRVAAMWQRRNDARSAPARAPAHRPGSLPWDRPGAAAAFRSRAGHVRPRARRPAWSARNGPARRRGASLRSVQTAVCQTSVVCAQGRYGSCGGDGRVQRGPGYETLRRMWYERLVRQHVG